MLYLCPAASTRVVMPSVWEYVTARVLSYAFMCCRTPLLNRHKNKAQSADFCVYHHAKQILFSVMTSRGQQNPIKYAVVSSNTHNSFSAYSQLAGDVSFKDISVNFLWVMRTWADTKLIHATDKHTMWVIVSKVGLWWRPRSNCTFCLFIILLNTHETILV